MYSIMHIQQHLATQEPEEEVEAASVPVDDAQPRCALSGEKFEKFWHDEHQVCRACCYTKTASSTATVIIKMCPTYNKSIRFGSL